MAVQVDDGGGACCAADRSARRRACTPARTPTRIEDGEAARAPHEVRRRRLRSKPTSIVFSAGIRPRDELARACGLDVGARGGIVIDDDCRTSDPNIYAIGECALWNGRIFGLVAPGYQMARIAARTHRSGAKPTAFTGADMSTKLKLLGVDVASHRRRARQPRRARAPTPSSTSASRSTRSWSSTPTASSCSAACWSATPPTTARWLQMMLERHRAAGASGRPDPAGGSGGAGAPPAIGAGRAAGYGADLLLQQRLEGRDLCAPIEARLHDRRRAQDQDQGRHAPAAAARRWSRRS